MLRRCASVIGYGLLLLLMGGLWWTDYSFHQAGLKIQSFFMSIHMEPAMQLVPAGTFSQGDMHRRGGPEEQPVHAVTIRPFAIGRFDVTFEEYDRFAIASGRTWLSDYGWGRRNRPLVNVSWEEAEDYAKWLSQRTGKQYRLPTEAEWEYASRNAGNQDIWAGTSDEKQLDDYAVHLGNSDTRTAPVGDKKPNGLGVYDMSGNVWEWVQDCWHGDYRGAPTDGSAWLHADGGQCSRHVIRGGSWANEPEFLRSSNRNRLHAVIRINDIGSVLHRT